METVTVLMLKASRTTSGFFAEGKRYRMPQDKAQALVDAGKAKVLELVSKTRTGKTVRTAMTEPTEKR